MYRSSLHQGLTLPSASDFIFVNVVTTVAASHSRQCTHVKTQISHVEADTEVAYPFGKFCSTLLKSVSDTW